MCKGAVNRGFARSFLVFVILFFFSVTSWGISPAKACPGGVSVSSFKLELESPSNSKLLLVTEANVVDAGEKLRYEPVHIPDNIRKKARVAILLVSADEKQHLEILDPKPAAAPAEWPIKSRTALVGFVFGQHGLSTKKVSNLVKDNPELLGQLADYAQQTEKVEALVKTLTEYEQSAPGTSSLQSALHGFSAQYNVALPRLDPNATADQQATALISAVVPAMNATDQSDSKMALATQSGGLAASVASLYLGAPVALAAGGTALVETLHRSLFPDTDFRPAFTQLAERSEFSLCTSDRSKRRAHTTIAYLWVVRVPNAEKPSVTLPETPHIPARWTSSVKATCSSVAQLKLLPRAHDWRLISDKEQIPVPVKVQSGEKEDSLSLDLSKAKVAPGQYKLAAMWDWSPVAVTGSVDVRPVPDLVSAKVDPHSADKLTTHSGPVALKLTGADFEFVKKVSLLQAGNKKFKPEQLTFSLPEGEEAGEQDSMELDVDTSSLLPGSYQLLVEQVNHTKQEIPVNVHSANPKISDFPLRANVGEAQQTFQLKGTGLERIKSISSANATWVLAPVPTDDRDLAEREVTIKLNSEVQPKTTLDAKVFVNGLNDPLPVQDAINVVGTRPKIQAVKASFQKATSIALRDGEIPAGAPVSFAVESANVDSRPSMQLKCRNENQTKQVVNISAGQSTTTAQLNTAGSGMLFLSLDPGVVGESGCEVVAILSTTNGSSDPVSLGHVVLLPKIDKFALTNEKLPDGNYAGVLTGENLQMIDKTGWTEANGFNVQGIATPVPGSKNQQTLKISLPWPSPAPQAPLYIWLRGDNNARTAGVTLQ